MKLKSKAQLSLREQIWTMLRPQFLSQFAVWWVVNGREKVMDSYLYYSQFAAKVM